MADAEQVNEFLGSWAAPLPQSVPALPGVQSAITCYTPGKAVSLEQGDTVKQLTA